MSLRNSVTKSALKSKIGLSNTEIDFLETDFDVSIEYKGRVTFVISDVILAIKTSKFCDAFGYETSKSAAERLVQKYPWLNYKQIQDHLYHIKNQISFLNTTVEHADTSEKTTTREMNHRLFKRTEVDKAIAAFAARKNPAQQTKIQKTTTKVEAADAVPETQSDVMTEQSNKEQKEFDKLLKTLANEVFCLKKQISNLREENASFKKDVSHFMKFMLSATENVQPQEEQSAVMPIIAGKSPALDYPVILTQEQQDDIDQLLKYETFLKKTFDGNQFPALKIIQSKMAMGQPYVSEKIPGLIKNMMAYLKKYHPDFSNVMPISQSVSNGYSTPPDSQE